ncbi:MAG TPA: 4-hydroxythreonine-4-phosphate dehydrogenase PdxA [Candidatus Hydrogenedentes bacterium]|nr:4-hydroxythreonine-4-phosphate dehydrogenase PdxA [Candidatus Hydrogenedentota bacterium]HPG65862.1 4-hydroxythreonine-4-phosphate dehydrogenase PdxA [Candidatus Hydrogenedentota bacterium]
MSTDKPVLAITMGDVNGVGPEILAKALAQAEIQELCRPVVVGSAEILEAARRFAPACPEPVEVDAPGDPVEPGAVAVLRTPFAGPAVRPGTLDAEAGRCAVEWVKAAVRLCIDGALDGIVTCPLNKEGIHRAGYAYAGHTELIAEMTGARDYRMCLFTPSMRVVHITTHLALRDAIEAVRADRIATSIRIGHDALVRLGLPYRRIAVAALNPHAGEAGAFGDEEALEIRPAIEACRAEDIACSGPYPADTIFARMRAGEFEMVIAMYHDQGHAPMKLIAMDEGVNVTLGLPIIRTSVDHGTAYDIAWTGRARCESLCHAIRLAAEFAGGKGTS